jgi:exopolysaccharide biosynthesis polyprenyl glycosylphosphotransferase
VREVRRCSLAGTTMTVIEDDVRAHGDALPEERRPAARIRAGRRFSDHQLLVGWRALATFVPIASVLIATSSGAFVLPEALVLSSAWLFASMSIYGARWLSPLALGTVTTAAAGTIAGLVPASMLVFWLPGIDVSPTQIALAAIGVFAASAVFEAVGKPVLAPATRVLVVGKENGGSELFADLARRPELPFTCIGLIDAEGRLQSQNGVEAFSSTDLASVVREQRVDVVVLAGDDRGDAVQQLLDAGSVDVRVVGPAEFYEHAFGYVPIWQVSPVWFMSVIHLYQRRYPRAIKRGTDIVVAATALTVLGPLLLVVALLLRLSGGGPVLYRQLRCGEGGRPFEIVKFRTMVADAEQAHGAVWAGADDPRITRVGRFLRRARVDELPQLWNVLRGEMSIVGPRPERPELLPVIEESLPFFTRRHLVKPGITGWAQIRLGYTDDPVGAADKLAYDLFYLRHRSLALDLAIAFKTAGTLLTGFGAR